MRRLHIILPSLLAVIMVVAGIVAHNDYGMSWDEPNMYQVGVESYNSVFKGKPWPSGQAQRYYGTAIELPLHVLEVLSGVQESSELFSQRRMAAYMIFVAGVLFFYLLVRKHFQSPGYGLLGATMLFLSPRMFAHAFYNTRDIPALVFFIVSSYTLLCLLERKTVLSAILHGIATAYLISIRITGVIMVLFTALLLMMQLLRERREHQEIRGAILRAGIALLSTSVATVIFWPFLWHNPVGNFMEALRWSGSLNAGGLFMGQIINAIPWSYVPVWLAITTPPIYTIGFIIGMCAVVYRLIRLSSWKDERQSMHWSLFSLWLFLPPILIVLLKKGIHGEYRHLFFIYPAFLLFSLEGMKVCFELFKRSISAIQEKYLHVLLAVIVAIPFVSTGLWMVRHHPFQNLYFSLPSNFIEGKFALDYWGLTFRDGYNYILKNDKRDKIRVFTTSSPGWTTIHLLREDERRRLEQVSEDQAEYVIDNFDTAKYIHTWPQEKVVQSLVIDGITVMNVYKVR